MKFGQSTEFNMKYIFVEKSYTKCGEGTLLRPFSKTSKLSIYLWINSLKFHEICFYCMLI